MIEKIRERSRERSKDKRGRKVRRRVGRRAGIKVWRETGDQPLRGILAATGLLARGCFVDN